MVKKSPEHEENNTKGGNSVKYKGVRKRKWGKWVSEIRLPNSRERIWLGSYDTPEKAARAFDAAQFCLRGKSANFNFPENPPEIAGGRSMTPVEIQAAAARFANFSTGGSEIRVVENPTVEESADASSYSPSISDGATTVQMEGFEVAGVEASFQEQLNLSNTLGSGNFVSEFGLFAGFDDFTGGEFLPTPQTDNFDYYYGQDDTYDASLYQNSYLWNF
ncbi:hypothetical protein RDABS01_023472 [Bienertia sinuspersici]